MIVTECQRCHRMSTPLCSTSCYCPFISGTALSALKQIVSRCLCWWCLSSDYTKHLNASLSLLIVVGFLDISRNLSQLISWLKVWTLISQRLKPIKRVSPLDWVLRLEFCNVSIRGGSPLPHFTWRCRQIQLLKSCGILIWDSGQGKKLQSQIWPHGS